MLTTYLPTNTDENVNHITLANATPMSTREALEAEQGERDYVALIRSKANPNQMGIAEYNGYRGKKHRNNPLEPLPENRNQEDRVAYAFLKANKLVGSSARTEIFKAVFATLQHTVGQVEAPGSCALTGFLERIPQRPNNYRLTRTNLGDSEAFLIKIKRDPNHPNPVSVQNLNTLHKPANKKEQELIWAKGGIIVQTTNHARIFQFADGSIKYQLTKGSPLQDQLPNNITFVNVERLPDNSEIYQFPDGSIKYKPTANSAVLDQLPPGIVFTPENTVRIYHQINYSFNDTELKVAHHDNYGSASGYSGSRSFGDRGYKTISEPDVTEYEFSNAEDEQSFLIFSCDGLTERLGEDKNNAIAQIVLKLKDKSPAEISDALARAALRGKFDENTVFGSDPSGDNLSVIVVALLNSNVALSEDDLAMFWGIFDGHNGEAVSHWLKEQSVIILKKFLAIHDKYFDIIDFLDNFYDDPEQDLTGAEQNKLELYLRYLSGKKSLNGLNLSPALCAYLRRKFDFDPKKSNDELIDILLNATPLPHTWEMERRNLAKETKIKIFEVKTLNNHLHFLEFQNLLQHIKHGMPSAKAYEAVLENLLGGYFKSLPNDLPQHIIDEIKTFKRQFALIDTKHRVIEVKTALLNEKVSLYLAASEDTKRLSVHKKTLAFLDFLQEYNEKATLPDLNLEDFIKYHFYLEKLAIDQDFIAIKRKAGIKDNFPIVEFQTSFIIELLKAARNNIQSFVKKNQLSVIEKILMIVHSDSILGNAVKITLNNSSTLIDTVEQKLRDEQAKQAQANTQFTPTVYSQHSSATFTSSSQRLQVAELIKSGILRDNNYTVTPTTPATFHATKANPSDPNHPAYNFDIHCAKNTIMTTQHNAGNLDAIIKVLQQLAEKKLGQRAHNARSCKLTVRLEYDLTATDPQTELTERKATISRLLQTYNNFTIKWVEPDSTPILTPSSTLGNTQ